MKHLFYIVIILATLTTITLIYVSVIQEHKPQWEEFKVKYEKNYETGLEETLRFQIFQENEKKIKEHNKKFKQKLTSYKLGVNEFADLTQNEFSDLLKLDVESFKNTVENRTYFKPPENFTIADEIDWRKKGAITEIQHQLRCGAGWAFSVTGALESQYFKKYRKLIKLSEQNLIDCGTKSPYLNNGCNGGWMNFGFEYVRQKGITTDEAYWFEAKDNACRYDEGMVALKIKGYELILEEDQLQTAVATIGPISVAIDASNMQFYKEGVFEDTQCSDVFVNHGVLVVGYGTASDDLLDYWLVKNSWGSSWGEEGYVRIVRGVNQCGIGGFASYPVLCKNIYCL